MAQLQTLYSREEIELIQTQIDKQMEQQINSQISVCLEQNLRNLFVNFKDSDFSLKMGFEQQQIPLEMVICALFSSTNQSYERERKELINKVKQQQQQSQTVRQSLKQSLEQEKRLSGLITVLEQQKMSIQKQNIQKIQEIYLVNETIIKNNEEINHLKTLLQEKSTEFQAKETNLRQQISELFKLAQKLKFEVQKANSQNVKLQSEFIQIESELIDEYQKRKTQLVTLNIQASQMNEKYNDFKEFYQKSSKNAIENRTLARLVNTLKTNLSQLNFSSLKFQYSDLQIPYSSLSSTLQNSQIDSKRIMLSLGSFEQMLQRLSKSNKQNNERWKEDRHLLQQVQVKQQSLLKQNKIRQIKIQKLEQSLHHLTQSNYKMLLEFQQTKQKLQNQSLAQNKKACTFNVQMAKLSEQKQLLKKKINQIEQSLSSKIQKNNEYECKIKQDESKYKQLEDFFLTFRESIKKAVQLDKDDVSNIKLIEHLVDKNAELMKNLTVVRTELSDIKQQLSVKQYHFENISKQLLQKTQTAEYAISTNQVLKSQNQKLEAIVKQLQKVHQQLKKSVKQKESSLNTVNSQLFSMINSKVKQIKENIDCSTQTQCLSIRQSQIRRQNIQDTSVNRLNQKYNNDGLNETQKQKNKQNLNPKLKIRDNSHKTQCKGHSCSHLQKITSLNEIINYLMNYLKGYKGNHVREVSWLSHQINRHGQSYQTKIINQSNFQMKLKNSKIIQQLCHIQPACGKLINQFQAIMEYYFDLLSEWGQKSLGETVSKLKLSKTINKYGNIQRTRGSISRIYS